MSTGYTSQADEQRQQTHQAWISTMDEARNSCREAIHAGSEFINDPERALWPVVPANQKTKAHRVAAKIHASVLDYHEHIEPFRAEMLGNADGIPEVNDGGNLWQQTLYTVDLDDETDKTVQLGKLQEKWADERQAVAIVKNDMVGAKHVEDPHRLLLPLAAARKCFRQLNECARELNLAVEIEASTVDVEDISDVAGVNLNGN